MNKNNIHEQKIYLSTQFLFVYIYNGIISPSLNPANFFQFNSR